MAFALFAQNSTATIINFNIVFICFANLVQRYAFFQNPPNLGYKKYCLSFAATRTDDCIRRVYTLYSHCIHFVYYKNTLCIHREYDLY